MTFGLSGATTAGGTYRLRHAQNINIVKIFILTNGTKDKTFLTNGTKDKTFLTVAKHQGRYDFFKWNGGANGSISKKKKKKKKKKEEEEKLDGTFQDKLFR